jgi:hypothetical protein
MEDIIMNRVNNAKLPIDEVNTKNSPTLLIKKQYLNELKKLTKIYKKGDIGPDILKIKEWLKLWQLNQNYIDIIIDCKNNFDDKTETVLKEIQTFINIEPTGVVDEITWYYLTNPMNKAFSTESYSLNNLREKMKYFALKHLQYHSCELLKDNIGPWVRSYMDGNQGTLYYWCQGFVCTILDQTYSSIGKKFTDFYLNTFTCQDFRESAKKNNLLYTSKELCEEKYVPSCGDMVLYIVNETKIAHHVEILYEVLDKNSGTMLTIGGNTNFLGNTNGVGVFMVDRNYKNSIMPEWSVEIVKFQDG